MAKKGTIVLGGQDSFDIEFIGTQTWTFNIQPSDGQVFSNANIKFCINDVELIFGSGIRANGDGYFVDVTPANLGRAVRGSFVIFGDNSDPEMHIGFGNWTRTELK